MSGSQRAGWRPDRSGDQRAGGWGRATSKRANGWGKAAAGEQGREASRWWADGEEIW